MQKRVTTSFLSACLLIVAGVFFQSCKSQNENKQAEGKVKYIIPDSIRKTLVIDTVSVGKLENSLTLTGKVAFNDDHVVKLYPMVSGNIQDIKVMLGDYVQEGQVLAVIKSSEMAGFSNDLVNAETNLRVAKKNQDATQDMFTSGLASQKDLLAAQAAYEQAKSELSRINRVLKINGGNTQGEFIVKAPISGFIVEKFVTNNMAIRADNSTNLFTISDLKNVWVQANVYESNIELVHTGDPVNVTTLAYPNKVFKGKIDKIMNVLDPSNKVMKMRVVLPNEGYLLKPEMFASVTVTNSANKNSMYVPLNAMIFDHSQYFVLVYHGEGNADIVPVQKLSAIGDKVYLTGGVNPGDRVIGSNALQIYDQLNN
jgi:cobalt-zinc-cadmium efflux system membrane fusion protein